MKTITVNVSEPVYEAFQEYARRVDRKASELIREAMEAYRIAHIERKTSLLDRRPVSVGGPIEPLGSDCKPEPSRAEPSRAEPSNPPAGNVMAPISPTFRGQFLGWH